MKVKFTFSEGTFSDNIYSESIHVDLHFDDKDIEELRKRSKGNVETISKAAEIVIRDSIRKGFSKDYTIL